MNYLKMTCQFLLVAVILTNIADSTRPINNNVGAKYSDIYDVPDIFEYMERQGYTQPDDFIVTAYLAIDEYEKRFHGITFSGVPAIPFHTVAVDPEIVPLGSRVFIEGLGWWKAEDTGNMIKGNRLDICLPTRDEAMEWGKRNRQVWFKTPSDMAEESQSDQVLLSSMSTTGES